MTCERDEQKGKILQFCGKGIVVFPGNGHNTTLEEPQARNSQYYRPYEEDTEYVQKLKRKQIDEANAAMQEEGIKCKIFYLPAERAKRNTKNISTPSEPGSLPDQTLRESNTPVSLEGKHAQGTPLPVVLDRKELLDATTKGMREEDYKGSTITEQVYFESLNSSHAAPTETRKPSSRKRTLMGKLTAAKESLKRKFRKLKSPI